LSGLLLAIDRLAFCGSGAMLGTVQSTLFQFFFCGIFVALAIASRRLGHLLDAAGVEAETETRRNAAQNARARERRRIDALMHDNVLSVLLASAVGGGQQVVAEQASRALRQIERYGADGDPEPVTAAQLVWELQSITTEIAPRAEFRYELQTETPPPPEIVAAVTEATAEALRNSVLHGDPPDRDASRAVHVHLDDGGIAVLVLDDGVGFDTKAVPTTRLGVSVSIVGRMRGVPGGYAAIESELGRGTTVRIGWMGP
jgi:signal transduction histidine kinase